MLPQYRSEDQTTAAANHVSSCFMVPVLLIKWPPLCVTCSDEQTGRFCCVTSPARLTSFLWMRAEGKC